MQLGAGTAPAPRGRPLCSACRHQGNSDASSQGSYQGVLKSVGFQETTASKDFLALPSSQDFRQLPETPQDFLRLGPYFGNRNESDKSRVSNGIMTILRIFRIMDSWEGLPVINNVPMEFLRKKTILCSLLWFCIGNLGLGTTVDYQELPRITTDSLWILYGFSRDSLRTY